MNTGMRVFIPICFLCVSIGLSNAQEADKNKRIDTLSLPKNELKINAVLAIVGAVELNYEYLLNEESGLGISVLVGYDDYALVDIQYYVSPYYRFYFGKKYASGFFFEGFAMLNSVETEIDLFNANLVDEYITDFALGIGLGGKWVTKGGFLIELNYGLGRNLFNNDETEFDFVIKAGVSLGYRF
jgi:hypothetical protein